MLKSRFCFLDFLLDLMYYILEVQFMKLKYNFVINDVAGSTVAVPVGAENRSFNGYIRLNETGAAIFELLKTDTTEEQIVESLLKTYDGTKEEMRETVKEFLAQLESADMLTND